jgi:peptidyl-prolyl cis-trans isomerase SurA
MKMRWALVAFFLQLSVLRAAEPLDSVVAVVNDSVITQQELSEQVRSSVAQMQARKIEMPPENVVRRQILDQMIVQNIQKNLAKSNNVKVEESELEDAIKKVIASNNMTEEQLRKVLQADGITWKEYKKRMREEMMIHNLQQHVVAKNIIITNDQVEDHLKVTANSEKSNQTYRLHTLVIPLSDEPTSDEVQKARDKANALMKKSKEEGSLESLAAQESSRDWLLKYNDLEHRHLAELPDLFANVVVKMVLFEQVMGFRF